MIRSQGPAPLNFGSDDTLDLSVDLARAMVHGSTDCERRPHVRSVASSTLPTSLAPLVLVTTPHLFPSASTVHPSPRSPLTLTSLSLSRSHSLSPLPPLPQLTPKSRVCSASLYLCIALLLPIIRVLIRHLLELLWKSIERYNAVFLLQRFFLFLFLFCFSPSEQVSNQR